MVDFLDIVRFPLIDEAPSELLMFGGSQSSSSSTPVDMTAPELSALRGPFADAIKALIGTGTGGGLTGIPTYNPATGAVPTAPIAPGEQNALGVLTNQLNDPTSQNYINQVLQGNFLPGQPGGNPFLQSAIEAAQRPTFQGLESTLSRTLPGRFTQAGQFTNPQGSSAFDMAARLAARDAGQQAGDIATNISSGAYTTERANQQQAVTLNQQQAATTIQTLQAEALPRLIQQYGIDQGLQLFQTRIQALLAALGTVSPDLQVIGNSSQSQSSQSPNIFSALFPAGL